MGSKKKATTISSNSSHNRISRNRPAIAPTILEENDSFKQPSPGQESVYSSQEYPIKCILDESGGKYLIAWEGPFEPTWENKRFANLAAVEVWETKKNKRYITSDRYRNQRPLRACRQVHLNILHSQSSASGAAASIVTSSQKGLESDCSIASEVHPSSTYISSQGTVLSGSIFYPDQTDQETQFSGTTSNQSQTQFSQSAAGNQSYPSQSAGSCNTLIETQSINISQGSAGPNASSKSQQVISEIGETPPSRFIIEGTQNTVVSPHGNSINYNSDTPVGCSVPSQVLSAFQTPLRHLVDSNISFSQTIPETIYQDSIDFTPRTTFSKPQYIVEESPSLSVGSRSDRGNTDGEFQREFRRTEIAATSEKSNSRDKSSLDQVTTVKRRSEAAMNDSTSNGNSAHTPAGVVEQPPHNPGSTFLEKMKLARERDRARVRPLQVLSQSATPSSTGDIEPTVPPNVSDDPSPLPIRVDKEPIIGGEGIGHCDESPVPFVAPQALHYNIDQASNIPGFLEAEQENIQDLDMSVPLGHTIDPSEHESAPPPDQEADVGLNHAEFAIPLSMDSRVKDDYDITLSNESKSIRKFLDILDSGEAGSVESDNQSLPQKMLNMVQQLNNITTHPDLNLVSPPVTAPDISGEASWAEYSSSKFQFLGYFIDAALNHELHVVIMAKTGKIVDIVKSYFLGKEFMPFPSSDDVEGTEMGFYKNLLSFEIRTTADERMSPSLKRPALIVALDSSFDVDSPWVQQFRSPSNLGELVPVVRLIISNTAEHVERCLPKCSEINRLRLLVHYTMALSGSAGELQDNALGVQEDAEETVAYLISDPYTRQWKLPFIETLEIDMPDENVSGTEQEQEQLRSMSSSRQKRWLEGEVDDDVNPSKRPRMTPFQDITHISDSMKGQTQDGQDPSLRHSQIPSQNSSSGVEFETIRNMLAETQSRMKTTETHLAAVQHRHETKHNLLHEARKELETALEAAERSNARIERQKDEILKIKEENANIRKDLDHARNITKSGGGLEADLEHAQEEIRRLTKENSGLERSLNQERSQSEYTRQQYQNASTSAAQSGMQIRQLEEQVQDLEKKAKGEATKLKELKLKNDENTHISRIEELETILASRDEILTKKEEEIRELRKNRPSTRATSMQPRSPKCGPSRSSSPAPNSMGSAVRGSALKYRTEIS